MFYGTLIGIVGVITSAFEISAPGNNAAPNLYNSVGELVSLFGMPLLFGIVGFISARRNQTVEAGVYSGLLTAAISSFVVIVSTPMLIALFWNTVSHYSWYTSTTTYQGIWGDNLDGLPFFTMLWIVFGGLLAIPGGLLGAFSARKAW